MVSSAEFYLAMPDRDRNNLLLLLSKYVTQVGSIRRHFST